MQKQCHLLIIMLIVLQTVAQRSLVLPIQAVEVYRGLSGKLSQHPHIPVSRSLVCTTITIVILQLGKVDFLEQPHRPLRPISADLHELLLFETLLQLLKLARVAFEVAYHYRTSLGEPKQQQPELLVGRIGL